MRLDFSAIFWKKFKSGSGPPAWRWSWWLISCLVSTLLWRPTVQSQSVSLSQVTGQSLSAGRAAWIFIATSKVESSPFPRRRLKVLWLRKVCSPFLCLYRLCQHLWQWQPFSLQRYPRWRQRTTITSATKTSVLLHIRMPERDTSLKSWRPYTKGSFNILHAFLKVVT